MVRKLLNTQKVYLVFAGKGGTGKSTVASNIACHLARKHAELQKSGMKFKRNRIGILDADIETPSVAYIFGLQDTKHERNPDNRKLIPVHPKDYDNIDIFSMGSMPFVHSDLGTFWDKEEMGQFVLQSIIDVDWKDVNTLVVDLPAGIDQSLEVFKNTFKKIHGVIIVTQPSGIACNDVSKAISACKDLKLPIVGIIENMSGFKCDKCGARHNPFGESGARKLSEKHGIDVIGRIPLMEEVSRAGDSGNPMFHDPEGIFVRVANDIYKTKLGLWR